MAHAGSIHGLVKRFFIPFLFVEILRNVFYCLLMPTVSAPPRNTKTLYWHKVLFWDHVFRSTNSFRKSYVCTYVGIYREGLVIFRWGGGPHPRYFVSDLANLTAQLTKFQHTDQQSLHILSGHFGGGCSDVLVF